MPPHFPGFLASRTSEVICKNKTFFVHSKILTAQSGPLRSSIMGVWKEATEGKIMLLDWDSETVGRFVEFLYTEDYHVSVTEGSGDNGGTNTPFTLLDSSDQEELGPKDGNILRAHAKVYALAQYKDVEALRKIALEKLEEQLGGVGRRSVMKEGPEVALGVIELLEYVYSNTDTLTNSVEPMRDLVSKFAAENFEKLMGQKEMVLLLGDGGDPVVELTEKVRGRLCDLEKDVQEWKGRATALEEKMWESAVANTEEFKRSEAQHATKIRLLERRNSERVQQLEAANRVKILRLETTNGEKVRGLEAANAEKVKELEINNRVKILQLEATNAERVWGVEAACEEKVRQFREKVWELEAAKMEDVQEYGEEVYGERMREYEKKMRRLEAAKLEKMQEYGEKMRGLEAAKLEKVQEYGEKMRGLEAANAANVQELEDRMLQLQAANAQKVLGLENSLAEMQKSLEDERVGKLPSPRGKVFYFLTNVCICCSFFYRLGFRAGMQDLEGQVDEWMLKGRVFTYLVTGSFVVYLAAVLLLVIGVMGVVVIAMEY